MLSLSVLKRPGVKARLVRVLSVVVLWPLVCVYGVKGAVIVVLGAIM